jgi:drug/metabolite transporter (DMT)-like permease
VTIVQPLFEGHAFPLENIIGNILIIIAGIVWAVFTLISKKNFLPGSKQGHHFSPSLITLHSSVVGLVTFGLLAYIEQGYVLPPVNFIFSSANVFWGVFYMSVFSFLLAYFLYEYAMNKIPISQGSIFTYLHPLFALPVAYYWLGETISIPFIIGALFIAIGVVFAEKK